MNGRVSRLSVFSTLVIALAAGVPSSTQAQNTFQVDFPAAGEYVISLPGTVNTTINSAETLQQAIPPAIVVSKFDPSTNSFRDWNAGTCGGAGPEPGALANCNSNCFCVDPSEGLGYKVTVSSAYRWFIDGDQARTAIALLAPGSGSPPSLNGNNLISLPPCTSLVDAEDLYNELDVLTGGQAATVYEWDPSSLAFASWTPGSPGPFPIRPGVGYLVQVTANATYVPSYSPALTNFFSMNGEHLISLPATIVAPLITNAEQLLAAAPDADLVAKWDPATDQRHEWSLGGCGGLGAEPGHAACGSACFCVNPVEGEGFFVRATTQAAMLICGRDSFTSIALQDPPASGNNTISLPYTSPLTDAEDLINDVNGAAGANVVDRVARLDVPTQAFDSYTGTFGVPFPLVPGEGYLVQVNAPVNYYPDYDSTVTAVPGVYVITGTVTTPTYAWLIQDATNQVICSNINAQLTGSSAADIANSMASDIRLNCLPVASAFASTNTLRVVIAATHLFTGPPLLFVGDTGNPNCPVTTAGCTFNPTITLVPDSAVIPTMGEVALITLALAVVVIATIVLLRRNRRGEDLTA